MYPPTAEANSRQARKAQTPPGRLSPAQPLCRTPPCPKRSESLSCCRPLALQRPSTPAAGDSRFENSTLASLVSFLDFQWVFWAAILHHMCAFASEICIGLAVGRAQRREDGICSKL